MNFYIIPFFFSHLYSRFENLLKSLLLFTWFCFSCGLVSYFQGRFFCHCNVVSLFAKLTVQQTSLPTISSDIKSNGPEQFSHSGKGIIKLLLYKVFRKWQDINRCLSMYFVLLKKTEVSDGTRKKLMKQVMKAHSQQKNERLILCDILVQVMNFSILRVWRYWKTSVENQVNHPTDPFFQVCTEGKPAC